MGFSDTCADLCRSIEQGYDTRLCVGKFIERLRKEELSRYHPEVINCLIKLAEEYLAKPCDATLVPLIVSTETTRAFGFVTCARKWRLVLNTRAENVALPTTRSNSTCCAASSWRANTAAFDKRAWLPEQSQKVRPN